MLFFTSAFCKWQKSTGFGLSLISRRCWNPCIFGKAYWYIYSVFDCCIHYGYLYGLFLTLYLPFYYFSISSASKSPWKLSCGQLAVRTGVCVFSTPSHTSMPIFLTAHISPLLFLFLTEIRQLSPDSSVSLQIQEWWTKHDAAILKNIVGYHNLIQYTFLSCLASQVLCFLVLQSKSMLGLCYLWFMLSIMVFFV